MGAKLSTYRIRFRGRKIGALGVLSTFSETRVAESEDAAVLALYDVYEHVYINSIFLVPEDT